MLDYRDKIKPLHSVLSVLLPKKMRKDYYRYRAVEMLVQGYTREEIASHMKKSEHTVSTIIWVAKRQLGVRTDIELTLVAHGFPIRHELPLSKYMRILHLGDSRTNRYVGKFVELLVRGYGWQEIADRLGKDVHCLSVVGRVAMDKMGMSNWIEMTLLAHGLIDGKEFCLDGVLERLTKRTLSGRLRGNAEQLPRSTAKVSQEESDADPEPGDRFNWRGRVHPLLP